MTSLTNVGRVALPKEVRRYMTSLTNVGRVALPKEGK